MNNKSAVLFVFGLLTLMGSMVYAAAGVRGAKGTATIGNLSTTPAIISKQGGAVYSIIIGTGAVTDYVILLDSANATAQTAITGLSATQFRGKYNAGSTSAITQITFDPPLQFTNGITAINATNIMTSLITYEPGRVTQGY